MCGLVASISFDGRPAEPERLEAASQVIAHRGPDDRGLALYESVGLAFRRLSILDLSPAGHQPMESVDAQLSVIFNGEIYNYVELRAELQQLGRTFRSSSDTEVLLQAYETWGTRCVEKFNGMWAFVIYDRRARRLFASRDRFGVKPLYRWSDGKTMVLASEIKAILAGGWCQPDVNWRTAARFLCINYQDDEVATFYKGIEQLSPGSTLEIDLNGTTRERRFWSLPSVAERAPADPVRTFRELFEDSVRLRMRSDVPVGVCLSGGIDSNAIISMMAALRPTHAEGPLQAFSYIPEEFSEADYIHESIAKTQAELNELRITPQQLWDLLPRALWHYDEPVHSPTALIGFELMRLARSRGVTVVLNGQGADEVNAGYHTYFSAYWADLIGQGQWGRFARETRDYAAAHRRGANDIRGAALNHFVQTRLHRLPGYRKMRGSDLWPRDLESRWYTPSLVQHLPDVARDPLVSLSGRLAYSVERRPLPLYLRVEDRNSMAHSVEARLPFLDYRLVGLSFSLPGEWKLRGPWNKFIVREAMRGVIAERVRTRLDKMGFPTPGRSWLAGPWYSPTRDALQSRVLRDSGICQVDAVVSDLDRHRQGAHDISGTMFRLVQFGTWLDNIKQPAPALAAVGQGR